MLWLLLQFMRPKSQVALVIGYLAVSPVSRAVGRSATAAAAYRLGIEIADERTGERHDYTRRTGVAWTGVVGWKGSAASLANAMEAAERRKDAKVARDLVLALPADGTPEQRRELAEGYARWLFQRHSTPAIVAVHEPGRRGDARNWHAHVLIATRSSIDGEMLGAKVRELDVAKSSSGHIEAWREEWGRLIEKDMRSHARRGTGVAPEPKSPIPDERKAMRALRAKVQTMRRLVERAEFQLAGMAANEIAKAEARELRERALDLAELIDRARLPLPAWSQPVSWADLRAEIQEQKHQAAVAAVQALPAWRRWWTALHPSDVRELVRNAADWRVMTPAARARLAELQAEHSRKAQAAQQQRLARLAQLELELSDVRSALSAIAPKHMTAQKAPLPRIIAGDDAGAAPSPTWREFDTPHHTDEEKNGPQIQSQAGPTM